MLPIVEATLQTPAVCLRFEYRAPRSSCLSPVVLPRVRGALKRNLVDLARRATSPAARDLYRRADAALASIPRPGLGRRGLKFTPMILRAPWTSAFIGPDLTWGYELILLERAAELWPVFWEAAQSPFVEGLRLEATGSWLVAQEEAIAAEALLSQPEVGIVEVGQLLPAPPTQVPAVRLHLLSPTRWEETDFADPAAFFPPGYEETREGYPKAVRTFVRSTFLRMVAVCGQGLTPEERELEERLPLLLRAGYPSLAGILARRTSESRGGQAMSWGGLLGNFALESREEEPIAQEFLEALWVLQAVHLGRSCAFGCGRILVEPLETRLDPLTPYHPSQQN